jgi:hypothetical protein
VAVVFASEAKIDIEAKISFRKTAKKVMISLVSHRSKNEQEISKKFKGKRKKEQKNYLKVPKRENFSLAFFAQTKPIWVCDLENKII